MLLLAFWFGAAAAARLNRPSAGVRTELGLITTDDACTPLLLENAGPGVILCFVLNGESMTSMGAAISTRTFVSTSRKELGRRFDERREEEEEDVMDGAAEADATSMLVSFVAMIASSFLFCICCCLRVKIGIVKREAAAADDDGDASQAQFTRSLHCTALHCTARMDRGVMQVCELIV